MASLKDLLPVLGELRDGAAALVEAANKAIEKYPDLATLLRPATAAVNAKLPAIDAIATPEALAELAHTAINELVALPSEGLKPTPKPGAITGG